MPLVNAGPMYLGDQLIAGHRPFDEAAIASAISALSPFYYLPLTGSTPFAELGSSGRTWSTSGVWRQAEVTEFDGGYCGVTAGAGALVASANDATDGNDHTWVAWVKRLSDAEGLIMSHGANLAAFTLRSWALYVNRTNVGAVVLRCFSSSNSQETSSASGVVPFGEWTHIAARRVSGGQQIYINGVASGAATTHTGTLHSGNTPATIGSFSDTLTPALGGDLAHVAYWKSALTPTEIATLAAAGH